MNKKTLKKWGLRCVILLLLLLSCSGCMLKHVEENPQGSAGVGAFITDFLLLLSFVFSATLLLSSLIFRKKNDQNSLERKETRGALLPFVIIVPVFYLFVFWGRLISGEFYQAYFRLIFSFQRPLYSILIFLCALTGLYCLFHPLLDPLFLPMIEKRREKRLHRKAEAERIEEEARAAERAKKKEARQKREQEKRDLFPDHYASFESLYDSLGYDLDRLDKEDGVPVTLTNGLSFIEKGAEQEVKEIPNIKNDGSVHVLRQEMQYCILAADNVKTAKALLRLLPFRFKKFQYVIVETPEGNWGRDKSGVYEEGE